MPAFEAWVATRPLRNPQAPLSPFAMPEYVLATRVEADQLEAVAEVPPPRPARNIQRASNYVLAVTLFAATLFFAGISTRLTRPGPARGHSGVRLRPLPLHADLGRDVPGERVGLTDDPHSNALIANAVAKPSVVKMPTSLPPCWNASGIIVSASIVRIAPPAKASTNATTLGEAPSKNA